MKREHGLEHESTEQQGRKRKRSNEDHRSKPLKTNTPCTHLSLDRVVTAIQSQSSVDMLPPSAISGPRGGLGVMAGHTWFRSHTTRTSHHR